MSAIKLIFDFSIAKISTQQPATPPPKTPRGKLKSIQNIETTADYNQNKNTQETKVY